MLRKNEILILAVLNYCHVKSKGGKKPLRAYGPHYLLYGYTHKGAANKQKQTNKEDNHNVEDDNKVQYLLRAVPYSPLCVYLLSTTRSQNISMLLR